MTVGFKLINDNGYYQIDENYNNVVLRKSGTQNDMVNGVLVVPQDFLVAFSGDNLGIMRTDPDGLGNILYSLVPSMTNFNYYFFGKSVNDDKYGFRLMRADGSLIFSGTDKPMRFVDQRIVFGSSNTGHAKPIAAVNVPQNKKYAVIISSAFFTRTQILSYSPPAVRIEWQTVSVPKNTAPIGGAQCTFPVISFDMQYMFMTNGHSVFSFIDITNFEYS